ncbi:MORC family CW-type zinc finger protein 4 isoform X1 [Quillaja saponaria]|uniref:MORC family CW-type zinc finger protein 4 isoform X1 n=1 Tax=Quillaja saponaria TaxID=32244 RepID=A0AAD7KR88_QUISA|nr:MORC family CW-type zinc finger protein 4 isoform X1 [Quillaja saponaria]KAJ7944223.1 MORC family CW-type zinc finger protein 4 isoform X1 [Quillaja saponaria]
MPPKIEKDAVPVVVEVCSSDDEDGVRPGTSNVSSNKTPLQTMPENQEQLSYTANTPSSVSNNQTLESRSFWKAGDYVVAPTKNPVLAQGHLEHARVHPKFLHSNATSHKWAFGAIAELLDNAVDEIHNGATFVKVDKLDIMKDNSPALLFLDDGGGMDPESIRKCMSLGYSSKKSKTTIGQYGNGFKTSTMRLGADAIVFSRANHSSQSTQSVGLLSYTFLRRTGQDDVIVPMVDFDISGHWAEPIIYSSQDDWSDNLKSILEWSPFTSKEELMHQFEDIGPHGTKVIIYNLWLNDEGIYELSFDDDDEDIRLRDEANRGHLTRLHKKIAELQSHISYRIRYSLRAYASMLYLRKFTNFKIILRGKLVEQFNIANEFKYSKVMVYRPQLGVASKEVTVETTIGFIKEAPSLNVSGFNVYHKNRLIRPFWKVTPDGSSKGHGVVGVLEANFIEPAHDKQDFERSTLFIRLEARLKQMINEYWNCHCHLVGYQSPYSRADIKQKEAPLGHPPGYVSNSKGELPADQHNIGIAVNPQKEMCLDQQTVGLPATVGQKSSKERPGSHNQVTSVDIQASGSVDQICEENIQLFMRCEEHMLREIELKQTVEELEKELEEAKRKCAQLSSDLERKRKQKNTNQQKEDIC